MATQAPEAQIDLNNSVLVRLDHIAALLHKLMETQERETDIDQTWVVGGSPTAASVVPIQLPRTLKHVEITFSVDNPTSASVSVALFDGNLPLAVAQGAHNPAATAAQASNAIVTSAGGTKTVRDQLGESGFLTVFFSGAAANIFANVRVRNLDQHNRPRR